MQSAELIYQEPLTEEEKKLAIETYERYIYLKHKLFLEELKVTQFKDWKWFIDPNDVTEELEKLRKDFLQAQYNHEKFKQDERYELYIWEYILEKYSKSAPLSLWSIGNVDTPETTKYRKFKEWNRNVDPNRTLN